MLLQCSQSMERAAGYTSAVMLLTEPVMVIAQTAHRTRFVIKTVISQIWFQTQLLFSPPSTTPQSDNTLQKHHNLQQRLVNQSLSLQYTQQSSSSKEP